MRLLLTVFLGFVFVAAFVGFFLLSSIQGYVDSPERMVASARSEGLREDIVDLTAEYIAAEVAADPTLESMSVEQLRGIIAGVITKDWLDDSLRSAHAALKSAIKSAEESATLDFRETKTALRTALSRLEERASSNCVDLLGAEACADARSSREMIKAFERRAVMAIDQIADEIDLLQHLNSGERRTAKRLHEGLESLETVRMMALVVLILGLAIIIALNSRPLRRMLLVVGTLATLSSAIYLLTIAVSDELASDQLHVQTAKLAQGPAQEFSAKLVSQLVGDSLKGSTMPVALIGVAGIVFLAFALLLGRRQA